MAIFVISSGNKKRRRRRDDYPVGVQNTNFYEVEGRSRGNPLADHGHELDETDYDTIQVVIIIIISSHKYP